MEVHRTRLWDITSPCPQGLLGSVAASARSSAAAVRAALITAGTGLEAGHAQSRQLPLLFGTAKVHGKLSRQSLARVSRGAANKALTADHAQRKVPCFHLVLPHHPGLGWARNIQHDENRASASCQCGCLARLRISF